MHCRSRSRGLETCYMHLPAQPAAAICADMGRQGHAPLCGAWVAAGAARWYGAPLTALPCVTPRHCILQLDITQLRKVAAIRGLVSDSVRAELPAVEASWACSWCSSGSQCWRQHV